MLKGWLRWGVKEGWRSYVQALPDGYFRLDGKDVSAQLFTFPLVDDSGFSGGRGLLRFAGDLRAFGHLGTALGYVIDPWLEIDPDGTAVLTVVRWPGRDQRIPIARLSGATDYVLRAELTLGGTEIFGGVYPDGTEMDDIRVEYRG